MSFRERIKEKWKKLCTTDNIIDLSVDAFILLADVRKMPDGGYGVYADKFVKGKRVMTPGGKHKKELKKVYKNEKDANDYMAAIMIAKGGG